MTQPPRTICVAITGSMPCKAGNPAVPVTISEQVESTHAAFEAGATNAHCHVRNDDETPSSDPVRFAALKAGLEPHCRGMIVQLSTGGRPGACQARGGMLSLRPDMAGLSVTSNNVPTQVHENPPDPVDRRAAEMITHGVKPKIEAFDLSRSFKAHERWKKARIIDLLYVLFVMGVRNAMPVDHAVFDRYIKTGHRLFAEGAPWCVAGIGPNQIVLNDRAVSSGGHARTGLEDNVRLDKSTMAPSNAALVRGVVDLRARYERPVTTATQARWILGLRTVG